jgi:hypothetical protein
MTREELASQNGQSETQGLGFDANPSDSEVKDEIDERYKDE